MALEAPSSYSTSTLAPSTSPNTSILTPPSTIAPSNNDFTFSPLHPFPPFFTLQRNAATRASQLSSWSSLIQSYCRHHHLFSLSLIDAVSTPLFHNAALNKTLSVRDAYFVLAWMSSAEGGRRAEFVDPAEQSYAAKLDLSQLPSSNASEAGRNGSAGGKAYIYWRRPEEWAEMLAAWVDSTGQKGSILTLYELTESDAVQREEWRGMDAELLRRSLQVLVKKGRAQVFGQGEELGVKFS